MDVNRINTTRILPGKNVMKKPLPMGKLEDSFTKSTREDLETINGLKAAILSSKSQDKSFDERRKAIGERVVSDIEIKTGEGWSYSEIAVIPDGRMLAVKKHGKGAEDPRYSLEFLDSNGDSCKEVNFKAYCVRGTPDGNFLAYGGTNEMALFTPDGEKKWSIEFEKNHSPYGDSVSFYPDGSIMMTGVRSVSTITKDGELKRRPAITDRWKYTRETDEMGDIYDVRIKNDDSHYIKIDRNGNKTRVDLPKIPDTGFQQGGKKASAIKPLTNGSILVTLKNKTGSMTSIQPQDVYLLKAGRQPVNLLPKGYHKIKGFTQSPDGSLLGIATRFNPGKFRVEHSLTAFNTDGGAKWQKALPATRNGSNNPHALFVNSHGDAFVTSTELKENGEGEDFHQTTMQAFDPAGNNLWLRNFKEKITVDRVESMQDGTVNVYPYSQYGDTYRFHRISPERISICNVTGADDREDVKDGSVVVIDKHNSTVTIDGVKLPINRSFSFINRRMD